MPIPSKLNSLISKDPTNISLLSVTAILVAGDDDLDDNSYLQFNFHPRGTYSAYGLLGFNGADGTGGTLKKAGNIKIINFQTLNQPIFLNDIINNKTAICITIQAIGSDTLIVSDCTFKLNFSDGVCKLFPFGGFTISDGTVVNDRIVQF